MQLKQQSQDQIKLVIITDPIIRESAESIRDKKEGKADADTMMDSEAKREHTSPNNTERTMPKNKDKLLTHNKRNRRETSRKRRSNNSNKTVLLLSANPNQNLNNTERTTATKTSIK